MASTTADAMTPLQAPPAMTQFQTPEKNSLLEGGQYEKAARGPTAANFTDSPNLQRCAHPRLQCDSIEQWVLAYSS